MEHSSKVVVRSYECDSYGHVNNAVYLNYLEYARHCYLRDIGLSIRDLVAAGYALLVAEVTIRFIKPAVPEDELTILTRPLKLARASGVLGQTILREKEPVSEAQVKWVCVTAGGRPAPLPEAFKREGLEP